MRQYDFSGLSPQAFQRMVQALATVVIGTGMTAYGEGPDGGRDASCEGPLAYPSQHPWDGYCVLQAKFHRSTGTPRQDQAWLLKEVERELKDYLDKRKHRRSPEYYIVATNVALTPVVKRGGRDRLEALLLKYKTRLGVRDSAIWDYNQLSTFLDMHETVRRTYAAWITPSDVLVDLVASIATSRPDFEATLTNFLAKELAGDQYARLEQAGQTADERIRLASVFVDLPLLSDDSVVASTGQPRRRSTEHVHGFIHRMVQAAADRLDGDTESPGRRPATSPTDAGTLAGRGRYVLIGGPGQGKTTLGQFLCQLFRVALLKPRMASLSAENQAALRHVDSSCAAQGIDLPGARRFPLRVVLSEFAAEISRNGISLLAHIAALISRRTDSLVSAQLMRDWLGAYPWLLVLDGLDEVPTSSNRDQMLLALEEFWQDAAQSKADILVVATTRPQGYNDEFSPRYYDHLTLAPLDPPHALLYAERLAAEKLSHDSEERNRILQSLRQEAVNETTSRLMQTPLQVTIMFTLVQHGGTLPHDRWRLFRDYYQTIYRREKQKPIEAARLLQEHETNVELIHTRVGLLLQIECEQTGGTDAHLTCEELARVVDDRLSEEGYAGVDLATLRGRLIEAAETRLVFLVGVRSGRVGFEIASLREFMAAQALFEGGDTHLLARLECIVAAVAWRNVALFAAGRCFAEQKHRDGICLLCERLDDDLGGASGQGTRAGAVFALELLEDGMARHQPAYVRLLARRALHILELPTVPLHVRLAAVCGREAEPLLRERIEKEVTTQRVNRAFGSWSTLLALVDAGNSWAKELADKAWPTTLADQLVLEEAVAALPMSEWRMKRWIALIPGLSVWRVKQILSQVKATAIEPPWLAAVRAALDPSGPAGVVMVAVHVEASRVAFPVSITPLTPTEPATLAGLQAMPAASGDWFAFVTAGAFRRDPSPATLAAWLRGLAARSVTIGPFVVLTSPWLPWPLAACGAAARTPSEQEALALRADAGELGDQSVWEMAERRWSTVGISSADVEHMTDERWPFDRTIGKRGFPLAAALTWEVEKRGAATLFGRLKGKQARRWFASRMDRRIPSSDWVAMARALLDGDDTAGLGAHAALGVLRFAPVGEDIWALVDALGRRAHMYLYGGHDNDDARMAEELADRLRNHATEFGVARVLIALLREGSKPSSLQGINVNVHGIDDAGAQSAAVLLRLAQGTEADEGASLANLTIGPPPNYETVWAAPKLLQSVEGGPGADVFLRALTTRLIDVSSGEASAEALRRRFSRRRSGLVSGERWAGLGLPDRLRSLLRSEESRRNTE